MVNLLSAENGGPYLCYSRESCPRTVEKMDPGFMIFSLMPAYVLEYNGLLSQVRGTSPH